MFGPEDYWLTPYEEKGLRRGFAETLRWLADKIAREDAFSHHTGLRFANRVGVGQVIYLRPHEQAHVESQKYAETRGVDLWFRVSDYKKKGWEERDGS